MHALFISFVTPSTLTGLYSTKAYISFDYERTSLWFPHEISTDPSAPVRSSCQAPALCKRLELVLAFAHCPSIHFQASAPLRMNLSFHWTTWTRQALNPSLFWTLAVSFTC
ncbi:hypothetical protein BDV98DRAFT_86446 [Pterulicium gracile]|uniref:Uncharacterized protein n=1 Tax=Pterulicium gracile TaxID=1884261 RepID=A0A5C3QI91_9AGAR|nr:hypothetical protein BDV98DRAFT_85992 [Pterula gracilis]TFL01008.1 hypothetical protein BDV98DRAFT_86446 [Pterula gracilis]